MAEVSAQNMSDERLSAATGKRREDWHALLDAVGAATWKHPEIARWLQDDNGVDGWWAQGITVGYEQAIGRRVPGQRTDGTFAASATKSIATPREAVLDRILDALVQQLGAPDSLKPESWYSTARWKVGGETIVAAIAEPKPGSTLVSMEHSRILEVERLGSAKDELRRILNVVMTTLA